MENKEINFELLQKVIDKISKYEDDFLAETLIHWEVAEEYEPRTFFQRITDSLSLTFPKVIKQEKINYKGNVPYWVVKLGGSDPTEVNILWEAQRLLNVTDSQAHSLFAPNWYLKKFNDLYKACKRDSEWAEWVVMQRLQHFIDSKGEEEFED